MSESKQQPEKPWFPTFNDIDTLIEEKKNEDLIPEAVRKLKRKKARSKKKKVKQQKNKVKK